MKNNIKFVFFGSSPISVTSLESLKGAGLLPALVVTQPDKPQGRRLVLTPSPVKVWAIENDVPFITPEKIKNDEFLNEIKKIDAELGVLVSYGKIIPQNLIEIFPKGILNVHPSLLPKLRGPSPIESTILNDMKEEVGVTIMLLDKEMDHGPILAQKNISVNSWAPKRSELYNLLSKEGGELLVETMLKWIKGSIIPLEQNHGDATYCGMIKKTDGLLDLGDDVYKNFLKVKAFEDWPGTYFLYKYGDREIRVKITDADFVEGKFLIKKVIPEGKNEMRYEDFLRGFSGRV